LAVKRFRPDVREVVLWRGGGMVVVRLGIFVQVVRSAADVCERTRGLVTTVLFETACRSRA
jgi:hypothetical protein